MSFPQHLRLAHWKVGCFQFDLQTAFSEFIDPAFINQNDKCLNAGRRPSFFVPKPAIFLQFENANINSNVKRTKRKHRRRGGCRHRKKQKMHWSRSNTLQNEVLTVFVREDMLKKSKMHKISRCNSDASNPFFVGSPSLSDMSRANRSSLCATHFLHC